MYLSKNLFLVLFCGLLFSACIDTRKSIYFNDIQKMNISDTVDNRQPLYIKSGDILQVTVSTIDKDISMLYNPITTINSTSINTINPIAQGYLVDREGFVDLPMIGKQSVKGKTTEEANETIKSALSRSIKNVFVSTRLLNFRISVLGDVARPGSFNIPNERVSLLDAISLAGDLNITAVRDDVMLIRETDKQKKYISIDLNDSKTLASPYFYLTNNDVVYVKPGKNRVSSSTLGFQLLPTILGGLSLITVILTTVVRKS